MSSIKLYQTSTVSVPPINGEHLFYSFTLYETVSLLSHPAVSSIMSQLNTPGGRMWVTLPFTSSLTLYRLIVCLGYGSILLSAFYGSVFWAVFCYSVIESAGKLVFPWLFKMNIYRRDNLFSLLIENDLPPIVHVVQLSVKKTFDLTVYSSRCFVYNIITVWWMYFINIQGWL